MKLFRISLMAVCFFACVASNAQSSTGKPDPSQFFDMLDTNDDSYLVWDEFTVAKGLANDTEEEKRKRFDGMDTNNDGKVDLEEFIASIEKRRNSGTPN